MKTALSLTVLLIGACATPETKGPADPGAAAAVARQDTGSCRPWFVSPLKDEGDGAPRHSCWNLLWEVPTALVAVPVALGALTAPVWAPIVLLK